jgi:hypothetical protein
MKKAIYQGNCTNLGSIFCSVLSKYSTEISPRTFKKYMIHEEIRDYVKQLGYRSFNEFQNDQCVSFHKSNVARKLYVFFKWSSIEYIWRISNIEIGE